MSHINNTGQRVRPALTNARRTLLHIIPDLNIGSMSVYLWEKLQHLTDYHHTVLHGTPLETVDQTLIWALQVMGTDVLQSDDYTCVYAPEQYSAVFIYDSPQSIPLPVPTIHYAYHRSPDKDLADVTVVPSAYRADQIRNTHPDTVILPPGIRSRIMRGLHRKQKKQPFTVGIFSSTEYSKYPASLVAWLRDNIPDDMRLIFTHTEKNRTPEARNKKIWSVPLMLEAGIKGLQMSDVGVYARGPGYTTPYGRLSSEIMAAGIPLICERRGALPARYEDRKHALFFDDPEQILEHIKFIRSHAAAAETLAANGQMLAAWEDITIHIGEVKRILRTLGA